ncbi:hypothetical protein CONPUDRAFT_166016 [Coniophora puteana RWD-64-598 SS2]|uniref:Uncharacterized protein n=1 Tax=Coniophora puteana (strain RWD-64-598) TaxID=741705 RepID=A0A5M3MMV2_CONPW|nr:uncharacterized protein CONPUDRAFT_166016 [Coniophora puteana RWD-64-598 SS2]EIW80509.1 hypothetical protein CONPUDRAFT_166016 [Coniophora puteana RWD-64-598 SS2]
MSDVAQKNQTSPTPPERTQIYIDILQDRYPSTTSVGALNAGLPYPQDYHNFAKASNSNAPQSIRTIDPTLIFLAPSVIDATSSFIVLFDGAPIHNEDTRLRRQPSPSSGHPQSGANVFYSTALVPNFWEVIRTSQDPTVYSILQDVRRVDEHAPRELPRRQRSILIFSAIYQFRYVAPPGATATDLLETPTQLPAPFYGEDGVNGEPFSTFEDGLLYMNLINDFTAATSYDLSLAQNYDSQNQQ